MDSGNVYVQDSEAIRRLSSGENKERRSALFVSVVSLEERVSALESVTLKRVEPSASGILKAKNSYIPIDPRDIPADVPHFYLTSRHVARAPRLIEQEEILPRAGLTFA